jgi:leucine dehydrogenase
MTVIARGTAHVSGLSRARGGSGDPSSYTALGVEAAVLASVERALRQHVAEGPQRGGRGLGSVGLRLARLLAAAGPSCSWPTSTRASATRPPGSARAGSSPRRRCSPGRRAGAVRARRRPRRRVRARAAGAGRRGGGQQPAGRRVGGRPARAPRRAVGAGLSSPTPAASSTSRSSSSPAATTRGLARERVRGVGDTLRSIYDAAAGGMTPLAAAMELARTNLSDSRA